MRKILLFLSFFSIAPCLVIFSLAYLVFLSNTPPASNSLSFLDTVSHGVAYAALPNPDNLLQTSINQEDGRVESVQNFFNSYGSVLANYANDIVTAADKYHIDYRLLPSIAMQESHGCKIIPENSYNCYGYGIYTGHVTRFTSYEEGIDTVSHALAKYYVGKGMSTPDDIMQVWDPPSKGAWSDGVNYFLAQL